MATLRTVSGQLLNADGTPLSGIVVTATLPALVTGSYFLGSASLPQLGVSTTTDSNGNWSLSLYSNTDILPAQSWYVITENIGASSNVYAIKIPVGAGPFNAVDLQYVPPSAFVSGAFVLVPNWRQAWSALTQYSTNDLVSYAGTVYIAHAIPTLGVAPPASPWDVFVTSNSVPGPPGPQGPPGTIGGAAWSGALVGTGSAPDIAPNYIQGSMVNAAAGIPESAVNIGKDLDPSTPSERQSVYRSPIAIAKQDLSGGTLVIDQSMTAFNGIVFYTPIWVATKETWGNVTARVSTAGDGTSVLRAAIYADDGFGQPLGALLADLGTQSASTTGLKTWTNTLAITVPGMYWLAITAQLATTTWPKIWGYTSAPAHWSSGGNIGAGVGFGASGITGAFPNPGPAVNRNVFMRPGMAVIVSSRP